MGKAKGGKPGGSQEGCCVHCDSGERRFLLKGSCVVEGS